MKKTTFLLFSTLFYFGFATGQSASATWPLSASSTTTATSTGNVSANSEAIGSYFASSISYHSSPSWQAVVLNPGGVGTTISGAHTNGGYVEFKVAPVSGNSFTVQNVTMNLGGNSNSFITSIEYALTTDFTGASVIGTPTGAALFPATNTMYPFTYNIPNVVVASGQSFYLRIYASHTQTASRSLFISNVVISGTTTAANSFAVLTTAATGIAATTATVGGSAANDAGISVTERGIVYATTTGPTTANSKATDAAAGTGTFSENLTGLLPFTTYYARAYAIRNGSTTYGNEITFTTLVPDAGSVTVTDNGTTFSLKNGFVQATITKSTGQIETLIYNGEDILAGGYNGGAFYWSWNMPNYQNPANCTYSLTTDPHSNNFNYAEVKLHMAWNGSAGTAAMDVDIYYSLKRDVSGIYAAAKLSHPETYPLNPGGEWRMASYPGSIFNWMSVDSLRNQLMPTAADEAATVAVPGAPAEVLRLTTGTFANHYECKYDYSADFGDLDCWGWSSTAKNMGVWMTMPSREYYPGGPMKRELMCHTNPVLLNMLGGTHYGMGSDGVIAAGENWEKLFGPFLIYCNKVPAGTANAPMALWADAIGASKAEQAQWPYSWFTEPTYVKAAGRGTVTGKLVITDPTVPTISAANMWIGVAIPPSSTTGVSDFQLWSKNYQFWVKTDSAGNFTIPNVLPGVYNIYAFGPAAAGQMTKTAYVTVTAGATTALGNVNWTPYREGSTVWEIGIPDRTAKEFKHGTDWWVGGIYPGTNWAKFMDYPTEFPNGITYTIGQSNRATDWNFVQPYNVVAEMNQTAAPEWKVKFNLAADPATGSNSSVYVAAASSFSGPLFVKVNGTNITTPTTGVSFPNSANATIRKGIHGAFGDLRFSFPSSLLHAGDNEISFTERKSGGDIQYDYIRLEAPGTAVILPVQLLPLKVTGKNGTAVLTWSTMQEVNNHHFDVQRSSPGKDYITIGTVAGKGNSNAKTDYTFTDTHPEKGLNFYRLRQVDKDGKPVTGNTVNYYNGSMGDAAFIMYPNPVTTNLSVHFYADKPAMATCSIVDTKGAVLKKIQVNVLAGSNLFMTDVAALATGSYLLRISCNGRMATATFIKK